MNRQANKDEIRAKKYLQTLKHTSLVYEPLGNVTPDFLLDEKIAVEVRRLNRNYIDDEHLISIENFEIHLIKIIKKIVTAFEYKPYANSAYVSIGLTKPLGVGSKRSVIKKIKKILTNHIDNISETKTYKIFDYLHLTFTPTEKKFNPYIYSDCNSDAFWVVDELHKNIQLVIDEKNKKIEKNFNLYDEWWLILVDSITYGLDSEDFQELKNIKLNKHRFSKVIILSPKGEFKAFEF